MKYQELQHIKSNIHFVKQIDFFDWVWSKFAKNKNDLLALKPNDRSKMFLRWKWGLTCNDSNKDLQSTKNYLMTDINEETIALMGGKEKTYFNCELNWERKCFKIMKELQLDGIVSINFPKRQEY